MNDLVAQDTNWEVVPPDAPMPALMDRLDRMIAFPNKTHAQFTAGLSYAEGFIALLRRRANESKEIAALRKEAERKRFILQEGLGKLLLAAPKAKGAKGRFSKGATGGTDVNRPQDDPATGGTDANRLQEEPDPPTLADLGISKRDSAQAQKIAKLPEEVKAKVIEGELTISAALSTTAEPRPPKEEREATALEKAKERIQLLEDLLEVKAIDLQEAQDKAEAIADKLRGYEAIANGEAAKELDVERGRRLAAESRATSLQNENAVLKQTVKEHLQTIRELRKANPAE